METPPVQLVFKGDLYKIYTDRIEVFPGKMNILPTVYEWHELDPELRTKIENEFLDRPTPRVYEEEVTDEDDIDIDL